jgi:hypothetical protein
MKKIIINSPKFGRHEVLVDDEDFELVSQYKLSVCWGKYNSFYAVAYYPPKKNNVQLSRLILGLNDKRKVDHADGNGLNNQKSNIRYCSDCQNSMNKPIQKNNKSGYKGVHFQNNANKFRVRITVKSIKMHGGYFESPIDAAKRYNELAIQYHGEFARLNPIPQ